MLAKIEKLKMFNQKMQNFYFCKGRISYFLEYLLPFKTPSNLWRHSFLSGIFTEFASVDERHLDLPGQLDLITALHSRPARKKTLLPCHALYFSSM